MYFHFYKFISATAGNPLIVGSACSAYQQQVWSIVNNLVTNNVDLNKETTQLKSFGSKWD